MKVKKEKFLPCVICGNVFSSRLNGHGIFRKSCSTQCYNVLNSSLKRKTSYYEIDDNIIYFYTRLGIIIADTKFLPLLRKYCWSIDSNSYASARIGKKTIRMHNLLMGKKNCFIVDHINRNKLDNRKSNLRFVTYSENSHNREYKGYHFSKVMKKWVVQLRKEGRTFCIGSFKTELEAQNKRKEIENHLLNGIRYKPPNKGLYAPNN